MLDIVILPHFFHLKNMLQGNLNKICVRILIRIGFPDYCVINIIQFHFRSNIIRFNLRRKEIKKTLNLRRMFDIIFGLPFWVAVSLSIFLPITPFWSIWTLPQISHFSACRVQLLNGDVLIVLRPLMVVGMTE